MGDEKNRTVMRRIAALVAVLLALALLVSLAALWFAPAPFIDETQAGTRIVFRAAQPITLGRCGDVSWQVGENVGIWVNGQVVAAEGTMPACIDQYFTRPQINVALPDGSWRLYELPVTSVIFSGTTALTFTARVTLAILLVAAAAWLVGNLRIDRANTQVRPYVDKDTRRGRYLWTGICILIWLIYLAANVYLRLNTPITSAPAEAYITPTTIREAWESAERPITIPLIYKLLNNDFEVIAWLQWGLALVSWLALACATMLHLKSNVLRVLACALILSLSLARDVYFWNSILISESISQSLFILLIAIGMFVLWVYQRGVPKPLIQVIAALGVLILTIVWSFTRDTNTYVVLAAALLLGMLVLVRVFTPLPNPRRFAYTASGERQTRHSRSSLFSAFSVSRWFKLIFPILLATGFVGLFVFQNQDANRGLRWRYPLMNIIARRVLPYPDNVAFFAERGMPTTPAVMRFAGQFAWAYDLTPLEPWLTQESRRVYLQYLLSDPIETFLTPIHRWEMILLFDYRVIQEHRRDIVLPSWVETLTGFAYPEHLGFVIFSEIGLLLLVLWVWRAPDVRLSIVIVLLLLLYPLAFMVWYGDGFAVERHAVPTAIQWRLTMWLAILFALDTLLFSRLQVPLERDKVETLHQ